MNHNVSNKVLMERIEDMEEKLQDTRKKLVAVRESEALFRMVVEGATDAISLMDVEAAQRIYVNETAQKIIGGTGEKVKGTFLYGMINVDEKEISKTRFNRLVNGEALKPQEYTLVSHDGQKIPVEAKSYLIKSGERKIAVNIHRDIAHRKEAERRLKKTVREKEVLIQEVHHRTKNNMQVINSLLRLQAAHSKDKKIRGLLEGCRNRIYTMALVHEKLYQSDNLSEVNMTQYLYDLCINLFESFNTEMNRIAFKDEIADILLSIDLAIPIGLILNELITNSLKHAFPDGRTGEITLKFYPITGNELELVVSDNGIGLSTKSDVINGKTLGSNLVKILAEKQLKGKLDIQNDPGTQYRIRFLNT